MGHEVEASHQENEVEQEDPVLFERNPTFGKEGTCEVAAGLADGGSVVESRSLREAEAEDDDQDGRTGSEPVQRAPAVRSSIY